MAQISGAGTPIDIKLGQSPTIKQPALNYELQGVYNALHILSQYLENLRAGLEGSDDQTPAENIRFLKFINAPAKQVITAGQVVTVDYDDGKVIKGTSNGAYSFRTYDDSIGRARYYITGMIQTFFGIAQNDAEIGENVSIGIGPGILKVTGAKSGQQVWAYTARGLTYYVDSAYDPMVITGTEYSHNGNLYLTYPYLYDLPGYPKPISEFKLMLGKAFASPIGICVADDYVLFSDFLYWVGRRPTNVFEDM